jgi:hypothetical protein
MSQAKNPEKMDYTYNYEEIKKLKKAFKNFSQMGNCFEHGDIDLASIYIDLKTVLGAYPMDSFDIKRLLDQQERRCIQHYLIQDLTLRECSKCLGIAMSTVSRNVDSGIEKIFHYLNKSMKRHWRVWSNRDIQFVLDNYKILGPTECAKSLCRVTSDIERMVMYLKKYPDRYKFKQIDGELK